MAALYSRQQRKRRRPSPAGEGGLTSCLAGVPWRTSCRRRLAGNREDESAGPLRRPGLALERPDWRAGSARPIAPPPLVTPQPDRPSAPSLHNSVRLAALVLDSRVGSHRRSFAAEETAGSESRSRLRGVLCSGWRRETTARKHGLSSDGERMRTSRRASDPFAALHISACYVEWSSALPCRAHQACNWRHSILRGGRRRKGREVEDACWPAATYGGVSTGSPDSSGGAICPSISCGRQHPANGSIRAELKADITVPHEIKPEVNPRSGGKEISTNGPTTTTFPRAGCSDTPPCAERKEKENYNKLKTASYHQRNSWSALGGRVSE